jgi:DNA-binding response OmpR family regulator
MPAGLPSRAAWLKPFLILLAAGLWCGQLRGATNAANVFETPPPKVGSIQWENIQRLTRERQEFYRKRVPVPGAMAADVPVAANALFAKHPDAMMAEAQSGSLPASFRTFFKILFFTALFIVAGILIIRKFAPHVLAGFKQRFNPWVLAPAAERRLLEKTRAEEEYFAEFLATFRIGPASSPTDPLEKGDSAKEFYTRAAKILGTLRTLLQDIGRESNGAVRNKKLKSLHSGISSLKDEADFPGALPVWQMASALEGLLMQLIEKAGNVTPSTLRAVAGGVDLLDNLCVPGLNPNLLTDRPLKVLVVDDDLISRQAMSLALKKTFGQPDLAVDAETALTQAGRQTYDVIFLDVLLPGMDGFELCTKIRGIALNQNTPVVFVTSQSDFDARVKSTLAGGNDLMAKPFLIFEITVKALALAVQGRLPERAPKSLRKIERGRIAADSPMSSKDAAPSVPDFNIASRPLPATTNSSDGFLARAATQLGPLRDLCRAIFQTPDEETRQNMLADGFLKINELISEDDSEVVHPACKLTVALGGLFKKLLENPKNSTASTLATISAAVDLLHDLCQPGTRADLATNPVIDLLVVDDDLVARRALVGALQTSFSKPENAENGEAALALAVEKPFDVIFLDVIMPGLDGFEVCAKIRETVPNRATPVVFVTAASDFPTRAKGRASGNDLMGKPFLVSEITVKALTFALRGRLGRLEAQPAV